MDLRRHKDLALSRAKENRKFLNTLRKRDSRSVDEAFHQLHGDVFSEIQCQSCANCCKTTSPIFYQNDIERLAKALRMRPGDFIDRYLRIDEDNDFVLQSTPCPFLDKENYCTVYNNRPRACREYPHTNRKRMKQIISLTFRNTAVCPAVLEIVERLKQVAF
jgi:uncharacterized protein